MDERKPILSGGQKKDYMMLPQIYPPLSVSIGGMCTGTFFAYSSVAVPLLIKPPEEGGWGLSLKEGSWMVSSFFIGAILGTLLAAVLIPQIGCKRICNTVGPIMVCSWVLTASSINLPMLMASRALSGACSYGLVLSAVKIYNAEVSHPKIRGVTSTFYPVLLSLGMLYSYLLGYFLSDWRLITGLFSLPSILFFVMTLCIPESPYWLMEKGLICDSQSALQSLRGSHIDISAEFEDICNKKLEKLEIQAQIKQKSSSVFGNTLSILQDKSFLQPLVKVATLVILVDISGIKVFTMYLVLIFDMAGSTIDPTLAPIFVTAAQTVIGCCGGVIMRYSPRRPLFLFSCGLVFFSFLSIATFSHLQTTNESLRQTYGWIPLVSMITTLTPYYVGITTTVHFNLQAESFPTEHRAVGIAVCGIISQLSIMFTGLLFPHLISSIGFSGAFVFFAAIIGVLTGYGFIIIPENRGESLTKTQEKLSVKKIGDI